MVNNGYDLALAAQALDDGADLVAFGRPYIANPDLVERLRQGGPFNTGNRATYYGGGEAGYTDYPTLAQVAAASTSDGSSALGGAAHAGASRATSGGARA